MSVGRVCDRCKRVFGVKSGYTASYDKPNNIGIFQRFTTLDTLKTYNVDLCEKCFEEWMEWLKGGESE